MTQETVAAIEGARRGGATEIVVADEHGNDENLLIELFPPEVRIVRGTPAHLGMMVGLGKCFSEHSSPSANAYAAGDIEIGE
jgi:D-amino peptidase